MSANGVTVNWTAGIRDGSTMEGKPTLLEVVSEVVDHPPRIEANLEDSQRGANRGVLR